MSRTRAILSARNRPILNRSARSNLLLAFDFDGTLSPIAPTPAAARLPARTRRLLTSVASLYPCAVISGRALADISSRLEGVGIRYFFGNHGLESSLWKTRPHADVRGWLPVLERQLAGAPGIVVENKGHSLAVHFRASPDHTRALDLVDRVARTLPHIRIVHGLASVNLLPRARADKGTALRQAMRASACRMALYVGDDVTDEDAFGALEPDRLIAVRVGRSTRSRARFHIESRDAIDDLLSALIEARS